MFGTLRAVAALTMVGVLYPIEPFISDANQLFGVLSILGENGDTMIHAHSDGKL